MNAMRSIDNRVSRRSFLSWMIKASLAGSTLLGLGALLRFISYPSQVASPRSLDLGPASDFSTGSRRLVREAQAIIIHDDQGYNALSLLCPHLGCVVNDDQEGFTCPCHGSKYDPDGTLRKGPSPRSLAALKVELNADGHLILYLE